MAVILEQNFRIKMYRVHCEFISIFVIKAFSVLSFESCKSEWKYNIRRNVNNSGFCIATMRRDVILFFELGVAKNFIQKF